MEDGACFNGKVEMTVVTPLQVAPEPEPIDEEDEEALAEVEDLTA